MTLKAYLHDHFVDKAGLAALTGTSVEQVDALVMAGALPQPTYVCEQGTIRSAAFGVIPTREVLEGAYFRPEYTRWVQIALRATPGDERNAVISTLTNELRDALQAWFEDPNEVEARIQALLPHFASGTFGLCVSDPSTGAGIVRKEVLQEKLIALTGDGSDPAPSDVSPTALLQLIDDYARAAMPFSPAEYARSSRKRLVDDLRPRVAGR